MFRFSAITICILGSLFATVNTAEAGIFGRCRLRHRCYTPQSCVPVCVEPSYSQKGPVPVSSSIFNLTDENGNTQQFERVQIGNDVFLRER